MSTLTLRIVLCALVTPGLLFLGAAAGGPAGDPQKKVPQDNPALERRVAELEDQIGKLRKEIQSLRANPKVPQVGLGLARTEVSVFVLKHTRAAGVAKALTELFPEKDGLTLRITSEPVSNMVLVRGSREELDVVEAVISKLEDSASRK
jgi:hypothetical protein